MQWQKFQFPTGWNSTLFKPSFSLSSLVSIPNGMEFYIFGLSPSPSFQIISIPNGMEFYWHAAKCAGVAYSVSIPNGMKFYKGRVMQIGVFTGFNSQRDEILPKTLKTAKATTVFQFPTGWNSTQIYILRRGKLPVSIPNGMKFYALLERYKLCLERFQFPTGWNSTFIFPFGIWNLYLFQFPTGWNSTVSTKNSEKYYICRFQFPTGWNSTKQKLNEGTPFSSFNSQRDEILHKDIRVRGINFNCFNSQRDEILQKQTKIVSKSKYTFQFPTGWNSTLCHIQDEYLAPVSIPNGMEFYHRHGFYHLFLLSFQFPTGWNSTPFPPALKPRKHSFNSQRDGILHSPSVPKSCPVTRFQFPTGWNSTCPLSFAPPSLNFRFNSQRDGILLVLPLAQVELPPFQFPTGWNSTVLGIFLAISKIKVSIPNGMEFYWKNKNL